MPQHDDARHLLPVWLGTARNDPAFAREMDLIQLHAEGLLDVLRPREAFGDDFEYLVAPHEHTHLVDELGMAGIYEAHVRRTGTIYRCPSWCEDEDHPHAGICAPADEPGHLASAVMVVTALGDVQVTVSGCAGARPTVCCDLAEELTAGQARQLAAALLNAADSLDAIAVA